MDLRKRIETNLEDLLQECLDGKYPRCGICSLISDETEESLLHDMLNLLGFKSTNSGVFLIEPPVGYLEREISEASDPHDAYIKNYDNLWDPQDKYCQRRRMVAERIIEKLTGDSCG